MNLNLGDTRAIIAECLKQGLLRNQAAYVLATAYHETAHTMKPVREYGGEKYLKAKAYYPYVGMGYVQLTWKENYQRASDEFGVDFVKNPKLLLDPKYAALILVTGMKEGWFTRRKLADYITLTVSNFKAARRIVNGLDKAQHIADLAKEYDMLLLAEGYGVAKPPIPRPDDEPDPIARQPDDPGVEPGQKPAKSNLPKIIIGAIAAIAAAIVAYFSKG